MSLFYLPPLSFLTQEIEKAFPLFINYIYSYQHFKDISYVVQKNRDGRFGSEAAPLQSLRESSALRPEAVRPMYSNLTLLVK